jgi:hypothetical protein
MSRDAPLAVRAQLAGLASFEASAHLAVRALYATYPEAARPQLCDEDHDITTARQLAEFAEDLLVAIDEHRCWVAHRLRKLEHPEQTAWPF